MLANYPIHATLPATDLERAKRFYTEKLGLTAESEAPEGIFYRSGDRHLLVFPSGGTASGTHTQLSWTGSCRSSLGRRASAASDACHWRTRSTTFTNSNRSSIRQRQLPSIGESKGYGLLMLQRCI